MKPHEPNVDRLSAECDRPLASFGLTDRQARFLVTVMRHAGVFVGRQYCAYSRIVRGQKLTDFVDGLVRRRFASRYQAAHRRAWMYHVHSKRLYRAIGQTDNRHRKPVTLGRAVERLMLLDAVLSDRETRWLATEVDKRHHFTDRTTLTADELPRVVFGKGPQFAVRYFPDKCPIGLAADLRTQIFLYPVTESNPAGLRTFIYRHAELWRALARWELRLVVPPHLRQASALFESVAVEELTGTLRLEVIADLRWFFEESRRLAEGHLARDPERLRFLRSSFRRPRYAALYRYWKQAGDVSLLALASPVLREAMARGWGRVTCVYPSHTYQHLAPLMGSA